MSARQYLEKEVDPVLKPLLRALVQERPHGATNILQALAKLAAQENKVTVCVTGCTGYVAAEVVRQCLDRGWHVKGTVRDPSDARKTGFLAKLAETLPGTLEFVKADLLEAGSFDAAVEGCTYVFHCASPFFMTGDSDGSEEGEKAAQEKLLKPAVQVNDL